MWIAFKCDPQCAGHCPVQALVSRTAARQTRRSGLQHRPISLVDGHMSTTLISTLLVTFLVTTCATAQTYPILFTQQENRNDNIYLLTEHGKLHQVTNNSRKDSSPHMSPDGKTIVFTSERAGWWKIWSMDVTSGDVRQLTNSTTAEYAPRWSPSGDEIAFVSTRDGNSEIYLMSRDASNLRNLTNSQTDDETPFWGSDGRIYYSSKIGRFSQLVSIDPNGKGRTVLTTSDGNKNMPQLSPDGKTVLYYGDAHGNPEIYTMTLDDGSVHRLTNHPLQDIRGQWSPDGRQIVFERGDKRRNQQIFVMNADGKSAKQVTSSGYNYAPSFVSDCSMLCPTTTTDR